MIGRRPTWEPAWNRPGAELDGALNECFLASFVGSEMRVGNVEESAGPARRVTEEFGIETDRRLLITWQTDGEAF